MLKIDGSFVRNLADSREQRLLLRNLLDLIQGFGFATVAEGVENAEDAALVCAEGVDFLQGYHLGPPTIERTWLGTAPANAAEMRGRCTAPSEPFAGGNSRWR